MHMNFIGGEWAEGSDAAENINPSDTRDVIGLYARASQAQAEQAIAAAQAALPRWAAFTPQQRAGDGPRNAAPRAHAWWSPPASTTASSPR